MTIQILEVEPKGAPAGSPPVNFGLSVERRGGTVHADLFSLEARGQGETGFYRISENLWTVANYVCRNVLRSEQPNRVNWTLNTDHLATRIRFVSLSDKPMRIDIDDPMAIAADLYGRGRPLEGYELERSARPTSASREVGRTDADRSALSVFTVPCAHPSARDGVFHCQPAFYNDAGPLMGAHDFFLADTGKILAGLKRSDPDMLPHAARGFTDRDTREYLVDTSVVQPREMGTWQPTRDGRSLTMASGQAQLIELVRRLELPFFPIAMQKASGFEHRNLMPEFGYTGEPRPSAPQGSGMLHSLVRHGFKPPTSLDRDT